MNPNTAFKKRFAITVLFLAGLISALGQVVARNFYVSNELVLITAQAGQNFYIAQNPDANGTYIRLSFVRPDPLYELEDFKIEAEKRSGKMLSPSEASRYWVKESIEYIQNNPFAGLKLTGKKLLVFLNSYEIPDNHNFYFHQRYSKILQLLTNNFGVVVPFFMLGLLECCLQGEQARFLFFYAGNLYTVSNHILCFFPL